MSLFQDRGEEVDLVDPRVGWRATLYPELDYWAVDVYACGHPYSTGRRTLPTLWPLGDRHTHSDWSNCISRLSQEAHGGSRHLFAFGAANRGTAQRDPA